MEKEFALYYNIDIDVAAYILRNKNSKCKCGKFRKIKPSKQSRAGLQLAATCGDSFCHVGYGKKRPEHSLKMKELAISGSEEYKSTLMKCGELFNKDVNTIKFKKVKLHNKGYDISNLNDNDINKLNSELTSKLLKSDSYRINTILNRYNKWEKEFKDLVLLITKGRVPCRDWLESLNSTELEVVHKRIHGVNTIRNWATLKENNKSWFKRVKKENLKFNIQKKEFVVTKSGLESKYIDYFENNSIPWSYEPIVIETIKKDGFHIPDFIIELYGKSVMLEVKGSFYRQEINEYFDNKVWAAVEYCRNRDIRYIMTTEEPKESNFLVDNLIDTIEDKNGSS